MQLQQAIYETNVMQVLNNVLTVFHSFPGLSKQQQHTHASVWHYEQKTKQSSQASLAPDKSVFCSPKTSYLKRSPQQKGLAPTQTANNKSPMLCWRFAIYIIFPGKGIRRSREHLIYRSCVSCQKNISLAKTIYSSVSGKRIRILYLWYLWSLTNSNFSYS